MPESPSPVLTPEQWEALDYRQSAGELDRWAKTLAGPAKVDDTTELVAKLGIDAGGSVIAMNRAHDRVLVPPPARPALAAFALAAQPFGFRREDVELLQRVAGATRGGPDDAAALRDLAGRLGALLPPTDGGPAARRSSDD
jgi:hypothetical protein